MCICLLCESMPCVFRCPWIIDERVGSPGAARHGYWELKSATLEMQQVLLTAAFFLHHCISLVSVAMVKHPDQLNLKKKQLIWDSGCRGLVSVVMGNHGSNSMYTGTRRYLRDHIFNFRHVAERENCKESNDLSSLSLLPVAQFLHLRPHLLNLPKQYQ